MASTGGRVPRGDRGRPLRAQPVWRRIVTAPAVPVHRLSEGRDGKRRFQHGNPAGGGSADRRPPLHRRDTGRAAYQRGKGRRRKAGHRIAQGHAESDDFHREIRFLGMTSAPAFVRQPEGNSVAERAIRTLKEQLLCVRHFATVEELRQALTALAAEYNASWMRQRHSYETPEQIRAEQQALETDAAKALKMAA